MAPPSGRLSLLAIVTIFLVVLGTMQVGLLYSRGDLDREPPTPRERQLHADLWAAIQAEREARGLEPVREETSVRAVARDTARRLAGSDYFDAPTAAGTRQAANASLPNAKGLCRQRPVKFTVARDGWRAGDDGNASGAVRRDVVERLFELLAADGDDLFARSTDHQHGLGVAVDGDVVYAVYRTCNLGY